VRGVLMPKTRAGMPGLPETPAPGWLHAGETRALPSRARTPARAGEMPTLPRWGITAACGQDDRAPRRCGDAGACGRDARSSRQCGDAHRSREQGIFQNDYALPWQECILSIRIWYRRKSDRQPPVAPGYRRKSDPKSSVAPGCQRKIDREQTIHDDQSDGNGN
jgi:hypothetical protein